MDWSTLALHRFGKTISVSMFAAAMLYAAPNLECSIYSTCKRISHKLLRNVANFLDMIYAALGVPPYKVLRANMEELVVMGPDSPQDRRIVNSYPSKVIYLKKRPHAQRGNSSVGTPTISHRLCKISESLMFDFMRVLAMLRTSSVESMRTTGRRRVGRGRHLSRITW